MRQVLAAFCALALASVSFAMHYNILALDEGELREPAFLFFVLAVLATFLAFFEAVLTAARNVSTPATQASRPVPPPAPPRDELAAKRVALQDELEKTRTILQERESQRLALETALRDVEGRLQTELAKKASSATAENDVEAQVMQLLGLLQERGRLVDFLMQDVQTFSDEQVGRAARVVHQGCRGVLQELCTLSPVANDAEGQTITVEAGEARRYRLVGSVSGTPPYRGKLLHRGWRANKVKLPAHVENRAADSNDFVVVPAEVEI